MAGCVVFLKRAAKGWTGLLKRKRSSKASGNWSGRRERGGSAGGKRDIERPERRVSGLGLFLHPQRPPRSASQLHDRGGVHFDVVPGVLSHLPLHGENADSLSRSGLV